ncbi:beta-galactosidase GalA [Novosphingobium sp. SG720]|uniref:beta-galactosidase GalA n=1 Tax=Novosphingobium sp. SG720 TaxID=2586998 RepID=UPI001446364A|nr:beta-galactosidase GalA [Novosphingobium sp. SG720]NKJ44546.1 beta-galactosidase [Novosphingobium sp. SG720]
MTMHPTTDRRTALALGLAGLAGSAAPTLANAAAAAGARMADKALPSPRRQERLADGWRFALGHAADMAKDFGFGRFQRTYAKPGFDVSPALQPDFDDSAWAMVRVPHDWAVELPYALPAQPVAKEQEDMAAGHGFRAIGRDFPQNSVGWYRRKLPVGAADKGRAVWLEFDGVFRDCKVFVNGYEAGGSASGYAPFRVNIADFLDYDGGPNQLALRVDASLGEGWFYEGAGIYRHVDLVSAAPLHVPQWGTCVRSTVDGSGARVAIATTLANAAEAAGRAQLRHRAFAPDGALVGEIAPQAATTLAAGAQATVNADLALAAPQLWSPQTPKLYTLETSVLVDGREVDRTITRFGIRTLAFDGTRGFAVNGQPVKLLGVCNHQDHAGVGTAIPDALHAWRVAQTQGMGANAWRSAHNPPSQALLDICDATGMMMVAETRLNTTNPEALDELDRMILSSRNHPSIILWSVGNEEGHQGSERGRRISAQLVARCKQLDPTRLTTQAMDKGWDGGAADAVDVVGFNYRTDKIPAWRQRHPGKPVIGTETASTVATRGAYANDAAAHVVRAYDTEHPWWASTAEEWWQVVAAEPGIAGGFIWTGFDYRGEPTPFPQMPSVSSYFGAMDLCGLPKDNYYYYRAWWRRSEPLVHLLPHWNWTGREGQPIEVWVHGNCAHVELLLNGKSLGRKDMPENGHLAWQVPYAPGTLEARGYNAGKLAARDTRVTAGKPAALRLVTERTRLAADGNDVAAVRVEVTDAAGHLVPTADTALTFALSGALTNAARIIGLGNGNPTSTEPDKGNARRAFNGLAQVLVQNAGAAGGARLTASAPGLKPASLDLYFHA